MSKDLLTKGIEIVGILFAAFGGFLAGIAPPQAADAKFAVGLSSTLALIILFTVASLAKNNYRRAWIITASILSIIAIVSAIYYWSISVSLTFEYPPGNTEVEHIAGTELTQDAKDYKLQHQGISNAQLLAKFGGLQNKGKVWTEDSVRGARTKLIATYVVLVLAIASAVFALTEGALTGSNNNSAHVGESEKRTLSQGQNRQSTARSKHSLEKEVDNGVVAEDDSKP